MTNLAALCCSIARMCILLSAWGSHITLHGILHLWSYQSFLTQFLSLNQDLDLPPGCDHGWYFNGCLLLVKYEELGISGDEIPSAFLEQDCVFRSV